MKKLFVIATLVSLCLLTNSLPPTRISAANPTQAPQAKLRRSPKPVKGSYIVVLDERVVGARGAQSQAPAVAAELATIYGGQVDAVFQYALQGFSVRMSETAAIALSHNPRVAYVEEDSEVHATRVQSDAASVQTNPPWGLDRIDERNFPLDNLYPIPNSGGDAAATVHVYVIDTGIRKTHTQFGGRANGTSFTAVDDGNGAKDCNGHGTHVAGIIGAATYGVAKSVTLHAVRVLNCNGNGTEARVLAGVDWVTANRVTPAVANMSLTGPASAAIDTAVLNSINAGITYVVAAGNDYGLDACTLSPARVAAAITVGSTTATDAKSDFSNIGTCLDLFAPGSSILSAWYTSDTATNTISGTSMAAPHVAGAAALYLQKAPTATPLTVRNALINKATLNGLSGIGTGSPNRLLFSIVTPNDVDPGGTLSGSTGTLSGTGDIDYWTAPAPSSGGILQATMRGPSTADFDLLLQQWNGTQWATIAASTGSNSFEMTYSAVVSGTGSFRWQVYSYRGSGSYTISLQ